MPIGSPSLIDAPALARIHIQAWRETYTGIMPQAFLDELSIEQQTKAWDERLRNPPDRQGIVIATASNEIVGFAVSGPVRKPDLTVDGEIYAINLLDKAKRKNLGVQLMLAMADSLTDCGFKNAGLWVLQQNAPARAFYDRLGGVPTVSATRDFGGTSLVELGYIWPSVHELKQAAQRLKTAGSSDQR